jgi:hypothetical protein
MRHAVPTSREEIIMSRKLVLGAFAAALLVPASSFATVVRDQSAADRINTPQITNDSVFERTPGSLKPNRQPTNTGNLGQGSNGAGMTFGNDPAHVTGPGSAQIDPSTRGPLNDVQPGTPNSSDPPQAAHPKPVQ